jgi:T5orf172 domain
MDYVYLFKLDGKHWLDHPRLFKIGLSGDPEQRLADLQRDWLKQRGRNVSAVKITRVWDMDYSEARLHELFRDHNVYARNHPVFTGRPISGDTEWHHLPWPWDVAAVMRAMEGEARWAKVWDYGLPIVGIAMFSFVAWLQFGPKQLPPVRQTQSEEIRWFNN